LPVKEVTCKSALSRSNLPGLDYTLNPYRGCQHGCIYCYAPSILREGREWGSFLDVRVNMPRVLAKELKRKERGVVGISTVTDPYQPLEKRYELTRRCLEQLLRHDFPVSIQTKSALVERDLDLITRFSESEVGVTITTLDENTRAAYEPHASTSGGRLSALKHFSDVGIPTWAFIGPIMPGITDRDLKSLVGAIAEAGAKEIMADRLRMKPGLREKVRGFYSTKHPELLSRYAQADESYYRGIAADIQVLCRKLGVGCRVVW